MCFAELAAVAFVEDEDDFVRVEGEVGFGAEEVVEFLDGGDGDFVVIILEVGFEFRGAGGAVDAIGVEALVFFEGLVVEVFAVDDKDDFMDEGEFGGELSGFKAGECFTGSGGMPDVSAAVGGVPGF